jgi:membrane protein DedA with SNARE-associated domain
MLIALASVTDSLATFATHVINDLGYAGIALLLTLSGVIGVPGTEVTMLFAGFNVYQGHLSMVGIIVAGVIGDTLGASIAYTIGYYGRRELIERHGNKLHVSASRLALAERWFDRYGSPTIFFSRWIPVARAAFPYAAGVARMPYVRFAAMAALGSVFWLGGLGILGYEVGSQWQSWRHHLSYVDYVGAALLVAAIVYIIIRVRRGRPGSGGPAPDAAS